MLEDLSSRFTINALTNGNANIHKAGLADYITDAYSSADVGAKKPHPDMFHAPLGALDLHPRQAVHIGDHLVDDIAGAARVGMHTIWVNMDQRPLDGDVRPTGEVASLDQLVHTISAIETS